MSRWDPWHGCHRVSRGCKYCYIHKGDAKRGVNTNDVVKTPRFDAPVQRTKKGEFRMKSGQLVYLCFGSDFLLEDADAWRPECWSMIHERQDLRFLFLTKRIARFAACIPENWGDGYDNVTVGCTIEDQESAEQRLRVFSELPIKHKNIICQPLLEKIDLRPYLASDIELVVVGGESDRDARPLDYDWVLDIRSQCMEHGVHFSFRQCGTHFIKDGRTYTLQVRDLCSQARKADIDI